MTKRTEMKRGRTDGLPGRPSPLRPFAPSFVISLGRTDGGRRREEREGNQTGRLGVRRPTEIYQRFRHVFLSTTVRDKGYLTPATADDDEKDGGDRDRGIVNSN